VSRLKELARRPEAALFAMALGTYAYFFQGGGWNQNSRFNLVRAIVEQGTIRVDDYDRNTGDVAIRDGRHYSDKAPGVAVLAVPAYAAVFPLAHGERPRGRLVNAGAHLATLSAIGIPSALTAAVLFRLALALGASAGAAAGVAVAYALATLALPYSTMLYSHQPAAAALLGAFALLALPRLPSSSSSPSAPARLLLVGFLLSCAPTFEYPAALGVAVIALYAAATVRPGPRLGWIALGAAVPVFALAAYHTAAWGGPLLLPGHFSVDPRRHAGAFMGISVPSATLLGKILLSPTRGVFRHAPWLALWIPGAIALARVPHLRAEAAVIALVPAAYLAFNSALTTSPVDWHAGWGIGPRHVVASLPFVALGVAGLFARTTGRARPVLWLVFATLAAWSAGLMFVATAVRPEVPTWYDRPFADYLWPLFREGSLGVNTIPIHTGFVHEQRQAWNLGEVLGLAGLSSLLPLAAYLCATGAWLAGAVRSARAATS
jgi:hypothetical protein